MAAVSASVLELLFRQQQLGVAVCDSQGRVRARNQAIADMFGWAPAAALRHWPEAYHLYDAEGRRALTAAEVPVARALAGEIVADQMVRVRRPQEPVRVLCCSASLLRGHGVGEVSVLLVVSDVTRSEDRDPAQAMSHVRFRTRMHRAGELVKGVTASANHHLRTPLAVLMMHLEMMEEEAKEEEGAVEGFARRGAGRAEWALERLAPMRRAVEALVSVAEEFTTASELALTAEPALRAVDIVELAHAAVARARDVSQRCRVVSDVDYVPASADPYWVGRALADLLAAVAESTDEEVLLRVAGYGESITVTLTPGPTGHDLAEAAVSHWPPREQRPLGLVVAEAVALAHDGHLAFHETAAGVSAVLVLAREPDHR